MELESMRKRIKELRTKKGLTQEKLAEMTDLSGAQISTFETGKRNVTLHHLIAIARALDTSLDYLVYGKGDENVGYAGQTSPSSRSTAEELVNSLAYLMDNYYLHKDSEGFLLVIDQFDTVEVDDICDTYYALYGGNRDFIPEETRRKLLEALTEKVRADIKSRDILIESRKQDGDFHPIYEPN